MSIGPFLELPNTAASRLREVAASKGILVRVETSESPASELYPGLYIFCSLWGGYRVVAALLEKFAYSGSRFPALTRSFRFFGRSISICRVALNKCYLSLERIEVIQNSDRG